MWFFGILTGNVGQTVLVFGVRSGFISRSVRARLPMSVCSGATLVDGLILHFDSYDLEK